MGRKRQRDDGGEGGGGGGGGGEHEGGEEPPALQKPRRSEKTIGEQTSHIKNKQRRGAIYEKLKHKAAVAKKKARVKKQQEASRAYEAGLEPPPRAVPKTIENTREADETIVQPGDEEVLADVADDEFAAHFNREQPPSLLVTTSRKPSAAMFTFLTNLFETLPSATYYARRAFPLRKIIEHATSGGFTNLAVFNEDRTFSKGARVNGLLLVHLPTGPSAHFRLSNLVLSKDIKHHGRPTRHIPELILNNFTTALGHRVGRLFASLLPPAPQFAGRRVVTLHNQRDFIFFRHHRYVFEQKAASEPDRAHTGHLAASTPPPPAGKRYKKKGAKKAAAAAEVGEAPPQPARVKARLQELGPRFTLRLQSLQKGIFDPKHGEYEWVRPPPGTAAGASRRRFAL